MENTLDTAEEAEVAIIASLIEDDKEINDLEELAALVESAGATVAGRIIQKQPPSAAMLFGKGKVEEIRQEILAKNANILVVNNKLSGSQMRNLTEILDVKVLDRAGLILDIFAMRATSQEGKLQVQLAQLKYNLPILTGLSENLSRFDGGIGMRGPGEQKLELDKRIIRDQIYELGKKLDKLKDERDLRRVRRNKSDKKTVSLVGYTNAGKSTILNVLARSDVFAKNMLFATLDPVTRKVFLDEETQILLTDTVGFIKNLPHQFINAFSSTLEEAKIADLLLIIMDVSSPDIIEQYNVVTEVLKKLEIDYSKALVVFNKWDLRVENQALPEVAQSVFISATTGEGIENLKVKMKEMLAATAIVKY